MQRLLTISSLALLLSLSLPAQALDCPKTGRPFTIYRQRDNNRCEGIKLRGNINSGSIRLISLATKGITQFSSHLTLHIPRRGNQSPSTVRLRSMGDRYQMDQPRLTPSNTTYTFRFPTTILTHSNVTPNELRGIAKYGGHYVPLQIGSKSSRYEIVLLTTVNTRIDTLTIRKRIGDRYQTYSTTRRRSFRNGELKFSWNGQDQNGTTAPAGDYEIYYEATIERPGRSPENKSRTFPFSHNPQWLL